MGDQWFSLRYKSQGIARMADQEETPFLELRFDGVRFDQHSVPVEVLGELVAFQDLLEEVARGLFLAKNQERLRVPSKFAEAARLHLRMTRDNCFTAVLSRPHLQTRAQAGGTPANDAWDDPALFEEAARASIDALQRGALGQPPPPSFPTRALKKLPRVGQRLGKGESLTIVSAWSDGTASVNQESRRKIAALVHAEDIAFVEIVGEVCSLDDRSGRCTLRKSDDSKVDIKFKREKRSELVVAYDNRPVLLVSVRGWLSQGKPIEDIESLELIDHERADDISKIWKRLDFIRGNARDGWKGDGSRGPTEECLARSSGLLTRLLADYPAIPRPQVYPTPEGAIQAEWMVGDWSVDVTFAADEEIIVASAVNIETDEERDETYNGKQVSAEDAHYLAGWLQRILGGN